MRAVAKSEEQLVVDAQNAESEARWVVGECAALWAERYARGRTDGDMAVLVGLSGDQVRERRRVWETFNEVRINYQHLRWAHFRAALDWEFPLKYLEWSDRVGSTVAEMRAWRRAQVGSE